MRLAPVQDCPEARSQAAALLPGRSLDGVAAAVGRALDFYATMGELLPPCTTAASAAWPVKTGRGVSTLRLYGPCLLPTTLALHTHMHTSWSLPGALLLLCAGAMTQDNMENLRSLLASLQQQQQQAACTAATAVAGGAGGAPAIGSDTAL